MTDKVFYIKSFTLSNGQKQPHCMNKEVTMTKPPQSTSAAKTGEAIGCLNNNLYVTESYTS